LGLARRLGHLPRHLAPPAFLLDPPQARLDLLPIVARVPSCPVALLRGVVLHAVHHRMHVRFGVVVLDDKRLTVA
jgi:hypothetical protein